MKIITICVVLLLVISAMLSCKKNNDATINLRGNWHLLSDSAYIVSAVSNGITTTYRGLPTDYYQFTDDGHLYVKEGNNIDTATYHLSGDQLNINYSYILQNGTVIANAVRSYTVSDYTTNKVTLSYRVTTPFAAEVEIVMLNK